MEEESRVEEEGRMEEEVIPLPDLRDETDVEFRHRMRALGYRVVSIPGDGNCLYHALSFAITGQLGHQYQIRQRAADYITRNPDVLLEIYQDPEIVRQETLLMRTRGVWGDEVNIYTASQAMQTTVVLHSARLPLPQVYGGDFQNRITISYHNQAHYNVLLPLRDDDGDSNKSSRKKDGGRKHDDDWMDEVDRMDVDGMSDEDDSSDEDEGQNADSDEEIGGTRSVHSVRVRKETEIRVPPLLEGTLVNHLGFPFLANRMFQNIRTTVTIGLMIPSAYNLTTIGDLATRREPGVGYIIIESGKAIVKQLLSNPDLEEQYKMFVAQIRIPWEAVYVRDSLWLAMIMITAVLAPVACRQDEGLTLYPLLRQGSSATVIKRINNNWPTLSARVIVEMTRLRMHPMERFCARCTPDCTNADMHWHMSLHLFEEVQFVPDVTRDCLTLTNLDVFLSETQPRDGAIIGLRSVLEMRQRPIFRAINETLTLNSERFVRDFYSVYILLVLDGPTMDEYTGMGIHGLLQQTNVVHGLYVGRCKNQEVRASHFTAKSAVNDILTTTCRVFEVCTTRFEKSDEAEKSEGRIIAFIFLLMAQFEQTREHKPFVFLNRRYELKNLLFENKDFQMQVLTFKNLGIPVYCSPEADSSRRGEGEFTGNYPITVELPRLAGQLPNYHNIWIFIHGEFRMLTEMERDAQLRQLYDARRQDDGQTPPESDDDDYI